MTPRTTFAVLAAWGLALLASPAAAERASRPAAHLDTLSNGLTLLVVEDRRAPVVTHMVWYRVGRADEPAGRSGLAHFVEHLMFKATATFASGELQKVVGRLGGADNALTGQDATVYHQRVAREHLATVMRFEADRMHTLRPTERDVAVERDIVLAERRQRIDQSPLDILNEEMAAALYRHHPYGTPVLGWPHEISALTLADAVAFYRRHYTPANALVVVVGDVDREAVRRLAETTYGAVPPRAAPERSRPAEPPQRTARRVVLADPRVARPSVTRMYLAPGAASAAGRDAETLEILIRILCQDDTSRVHRHLVAELGLAVAADGGYQSRLRDHGQLACHVVAAHGKDATAVEEALDRVLAAARDGGVSDAEVELARRVIETRHLFEMDRQFNVANRYGAALANGQPLAAVESYLDRLRDVTAADVADMARRVLVAPGSVTGWLVPAARPIARSEEAPR